MNWLNIYPYESIHYSYLYEIKAQHNINCLCYFLFLFSFFYFLLICWPNFCLVFFCIVLYYVWKYFTIFIAVIYRLIRCKSCLMCAIEECNIYHFNLFPFSSFAKKKETISLTNFGKNWIQKKWFFGVIEKSTPCRMKETSNITKGNMEHEKSVST